MKRNLFIATALALCAAAGAASAGDKDKDKKDKDRDRPVSSQPVQPAPRPQPIQRPDRPALQPRPRPVQAAPQPSFRPPRTERTTPPPPPAARIDRPDRQDQKLRPDRTARPDRPDRVDQVPRADRPDRMDRPPVADRPDRAQRPRPTQPRADMPTPPPRPRPDARVRTGHPPRAPRPVIAERAPDRVKAPRAALPTRPDRARALRPARPASAAAIARSRAIHEALKAQRTRTFQFRGRNLPAFKVRPYRYPAGWRYRAWRRHQRFPAELFLSAYFLNDFLRYGLFAPPPGYYWVRFGPDAVLVNGSSYDVADTAYGVFDDGSAYPGYDSANLPPIDPDLPETFADGSLDLGALTDQSDACGFFYGDGQTQDDIDAAWSDQDWNGLAKTVIWAGCGNDVSYYLLGLAAEGLALPDAAATYYGRALDMADGDVDSSFKCAQSDGDTCRGLDIGAEASNGLDRIYGPPQ